MAIALMLHTRVPRVVARPGGADVTDGWTWFLPCTCGMMRGMRAFLITTAALFGLVAIAHLLRTIAERSRLAEDPWFYLEGPGLGLLAAGLTFWAVRLLRRTARA